VVQESFQFSGADGVLELADGLGLDLADALARDFEDAADLFERVGVAVADAVAQLDDLALAVGQRLEDDVDPVLEHFLRGRGDGRIDRVVLDEIAEVAVLALADGPGFLGFSPRKARRPQRGFASLSRNQRRSECGVLFDRNYCVRQEHARRLCRVAARGGRIDP